MLIFARICRLCMSDTNVWKNLNDFDSDIPLWSKQFFFLSEYKSEFDCYLPTSLCESCYKKLIEIHEFKRRCVRSKDNLICYFKQLLCTELRPTSIMPDGTVSLSFKKELNVKKEVEFNINNLQKLNEEKSNVEDAKNGVVSVIFKKEINNIMEMLTVKKNIDVELETCSPPDLTCNTPEPGYNNLISQSISTEEVNKSAENISGKEVEKYPDYSVIPDKDVGVSPDVSNSITLVESSENINHNVTRNCDENMEIDLNDVELSFNSLHTSNMSTINRETQETTEVQSRCDLMQELEDDDPVMDTDQMIDTAETTKNVENILNEKTERTSTEENEIESLLKLIGASSNVLNNKTGFIDIRKCDKSKLLDLVASEFFFNPVNDTSVTNNAVDLMKDKNVVPTTPRTFMEENKSFFLKIKSYFCQICDEGFTLKRGLKKHLRRTHRNCENKLQMDNRTSNCGPSTSNTVNNSSISNEANTARDHDGSNKNGYADINDTSENVCASAGNTDSNFFNGEMLNDARTGYRLAKKFGAVRNPENPNVFILKNAMDPDSTYSYVFEPIIRKYLCLNCKQQFSAARTLMQHMKRYIMEKKFACHICGRRTFTKPEMVSHCATHMNNRRVSCEQCNKTFKTYQCLRNHMLIHNKTYICEHCGKYFTKSGLKKHHVSMSLEKKYICETCGERFKRPNSLVMHSLKHLENKPLLECKICHKKLTTTDGLRLHWRRHEEYQQHKCNFCKKCFNSKTHLDEHKRIHTGEKPYKCPHCSKCFRKRPAFVNHVRVHTGERPFGCDICQRRFTQATSLQVHKRTHTGEKPYKCETCGKAYAQSYVYKQHVKKKHSEQQTDNNKLQSV